MHLTNTWKARLHRWRRPARSGGVAVVSVASIFGAAAGFKVFLAPDRPDIAGRRPTRQQPAGSNRRLRLRFRRHLAHRHHHATGDPRPFHHPARRRDPPCRPHPPRW